MKEGATITCKKCGVKHYMTLDGKGHMMPVFCCGSELKKTAGKATSSNALTQTARKKK
jgi:hypothetical protein